MTRDDELADLAADLVAVPTENPPGDERPCAEFVVDWFESRGIEARLVEKPSAERAQAVAWVGDDPRDETGGGASDETAGESADAPTLVLNGHLDVVPAGDPDEWTHDPFAGVVEDGRLHGRGSADMKTNLAAAMLTVRDLAPEIESGDLDGTLVFHGAMGEETGHPGTRTLIEAGYGGDCAVVLEPTDFRVGTSGKGVVTYRVGVSGSASHASRPDQGTNAIDAARPVLDAVDEYDDRLRERTDPLVGRAYATVTEFEAGTDSNMAVLPGRAEFLLDRRILPDERFEAVEGEIETLLAEVEREADVETDLSLVKHYASAGIDPDHPLAERFRRLSAESADAPREPWGLEAATDAREFVAAGTPAIIWGPGNLAQAHAVDEYIDLADAATGLDILTDGVRGVLSDE
ncbi:M20 family metallopeptidase [Halorussus gelatinilyticus]|uniref:M20 family metallopeptidase n=1 Tax=Halorussus gelatinilyticus TaxID=2937524 RepID=A0A8U0IMM4_9EURY|nr:M20 family metallopeptidase [Halorussus gelatinilyticus]UPW01269.1 M20 family metallopeptidase [Halorussus gelatinilyticus]